MTSILVQNLLATLDERSDAEFKTALGLSKSDFLKTVDRKAEREARCVARVGETAPDFSAHKLTSDGSISATTISLSDLRGTPVSLIFGCYTCPILRRQMARAKDLIVTYEPDIQFYFVYVLEAHPTDGWNTPSNEAADIMYRQPTTMTERAKIARDFRDAYELTSPILLDWDDNRIDDDYGGVPQRLYVLDANGVVTFKSGQGPYPDEHLEDWALALARVSS